MKVLNSGEEENQSHLFVLSLLLFYKNVNLHTNF